MLGGWKNLDFSWFWGPKVGGGNSNIFGIFTPKYLGKMNPIWLAHIFQMGWFNHQL